GPPRGRGLSGPQLLLVPSNRRARSTLGEDAQPRSSQWRQGARELISRAASRDAQRWGQARALLYDERGLPR
ncbi:MAG: hypothetical protein ACRDTT_31375, partial [Pseudonocardiaceae bacterium]